LTLKAAGLVRELIKTVKVIKSGELTRKVMLKGINVSAGAKAAIEAAGGTVEIMPVVPKGKLVAKVKSVAKAAAA
jgi:large subunit ribosomal protein L15